MKRREFLVFIQCQIDEINKYREKMLLISPETYKDQYVFEWIQKYSKEFRRKWNKENPKIVK